MSKMEKNESTRPWNKPSRSRESAENYLRAILEIRSSHGRCRNVDIARHLGISRASVSKALVKLSEAGLVEVVDHDVGFTPEGRAIAEATECEASFLREAAARRRGRRRRSIQRCLPPGALRLRRFFREALFPLDEESSLRVKRRLSAPGARKPRVTTREEWLRNQPVS